MEIIVDVRQFGLYCSKICVISAVFSLYSHHYIGEELRYFGDIMAEFREAL